VYEINGAESRILATVGAFRVVSEGDLHDDGRIPAEPCATSNERVCCARLY
jgi:hypothetical protein